MSLGHEILAVVTRGLLRAAESRGLDRAALLGEAGLSDDAIERPDNWVPIAQHLRLGQAIAAAFPERNVGLQTGAPIFSDPRGALGYCLRRSQVHRRALENFARYIGTVNRTIRVVFVREHVGTAVVLEMLPEMAAAGHPAEALFAAWMSISRFLTRSKWKPLEVEFVHQPFGNTEEHGALFGCPVGFGRDRNRLVLSEDAGALAIPETSHEFDSVIQSAADYAKTLVQGDEAARESLSGLLERLTTTPMHLAAMNSDLSQDWLRARLALGRALLERTRACVHEAAFLLGFEGLQPFEQAFFQRFGMLPRPEGFRN